jgi:hypothetical protein
VRARRRAGGRPAVGHPSGRAQDLLHRLDRGGQAGHGRLRRSGEAGHPRARRQERQHRLRRRRPRAGRGHRPLRVFDNAGQDCCARSRILVERSVFDRFMDAARAGGARVRVLDPAREESEMGPLISADHRNRVASFVPDDAPVAFRGTRPTGPGSGSRRRCWRRSPRTGPSARRSSARWSSWCPSRTRPTRSGSPTTPLRAVGLDLDPRRRAGAAGRPGGRIREPVGQLALLGALLDAVRRIQAVRVSGASSGRRPRLVHRHQERVHLSE